MKAIILVGGQGTRLRPLTDHVPKNVVPLCNVPFLTYPLEQLKRAGVRDVVFSVGYMPGAIRRIYGDGRRWGVRIRYAVESKPLGTAGAIKNAERYVAGHPVFVLNGDILSDMDLRRLASFHRRNRALATLGLTRVPDPSAYGLVLLGRQGRVQRFLEKPGPAETVTNVINAGIYLFEPAVLARIPEGSAYSSERSLFPGLLSEGRRLFGFVWDGYWQDIGTPRKYLTSHWDVLSGRFPVLAPGLRRDRRGVHWGRGVRVGRDVVVQGPAVVGHGCVLEEGAQVLPYTVLGDRCRVQRRAVLSKCLLWGGASTGEETNLSEVVLGTRCRLGDRSRVMPGSVLADFTRG
jgi:NDP-sugar pyrophosphorylase family protein